MSWSLSEAGIVGVAQAAGNAQTGQAKSATCVGCHGANGQGVGPNPAIAGKPEAQLVQALKDYKSGARPNPMKEGVERQPVAVRSPGILQGSS